MPAQAIVHVVRGGGARNVSRICSQFQYLSRRGRLDLRFSERHGGGVMPPDQFRAWADRWAAQAGNYVNGEPVGDADQAMTTHIVVSFPPGTDPNAAHRAGRAWAEDMFGALHNHDVFDYLTAFHIDREHPHLHVVVNRRSLSPGHGWLKIARRNEAINYDLMRARLVLQARAEGIDLRADYRVPQVFGPAPGPLPVREAIEVREHWGNAAPNGQNGAPGPGGGGGAPPGGGQPPGGGRPPGPPRGGPPAPPPPPGGWRGPAPGVAGPSRWEPGAGGGGGSAHDSPAKSKARLEADNWLGNALQDLSRSVSHLYDPGILKRDLNFISKLQDYRRQFGETYDLKEFLSRSGYQLPNETDRPQPAGGPANADGAASHKVASGGGGAGGEPEKGTRPVAGSKRHRSDAALDAALRATGGAVEPGPPPAKRARPDQETPVSRHNSGSGATEPDLFDEPDLPGSSPAVDQPPAGGYDSDELYDDPTSTPRSSQQFPVEFGGGSGSGEPYQFTGLSPNNAEDPESPRPDGGYESDDPHGSPTPPESTSARAQHHDGSDGGSGSNITDESEEPLSPDASLAVDEARRRQAEAMRQRVIAADRRRREQEVWSQGKAMRPQTIDEAGAGAAPAQEAAGGGPDGAAQGSPAAPRVPETAQQRADRLAAARARRRGDDVDWDIETRAQHRQREADEERPRKANEAQQIEDGPVAGRTRRAKRDRDETR